MHSLTPSGGEDIQRPIKEELGLCWMFLILERPVIVARPRDATVSERSVVRLQCRATGDPEPVIVWTKRDGQIPAERSVERAVTCSSIVDMQLEHHAMFTPPTTT